MILAAHQPNHLPWLGFFDKMRRADVFVLVDHVQFERQSFQNRTRIQTGEGPRWLTVPIFHGAREDPIWAKQIDNHRQGRMRWGRKAALTLAYAYAAAPHYKDLARELSAVYEARWNSLVDLNMRLLELCRGALKLRTPLVRSSSLRPDGAKSDMLVSMCRRMGAKTYLTGMGGSRAYLERETFGRAGIELRWQEFKHPTYPQLHSNGKGFVAGLSVLDLLFNCGSRSAEVLREESHVPALDHRA